MTNLNRITAVIALFLTPFLTPGAAASGPIERAKENGVLTIFAASSIGPAIEDITVGFRRQKDVKVRISIASSAALARQIERGAPADIFVSADRRWLSYLRDRVALMDREGFPVATNHLVVAEFKDRADQERDAAQALLNEPKDWLAVGDPALSPLGAYTLEALRSLKIERQLAGRLAYAADARGTLALLQSGAVPLAILYESDARSAPELRIVGRLDPSLHRPILYSAIAIRNGKEAQAFLEYLTAPEAQKVLEARGFGGPANNTGQE